MIILWQDEIYRQTVYIVLLTLFALGVPLFILRKKNSHYQAAWASLKSWLFAAPLLFAILGLREPYDLITLVLLAILGAKVFFQMMGMYHRSNFVWATYLGIIALGYCIYADRLSLFQNMPMIFLGMICWIPILRDSSKQMIQYLSLTLMAFSFLGWSFMHLGWILRLDHGPYLVIYIMILTEVCDNIYLSLSRYIGNIKLFQRISPKRNLESFVIAFALTLGLAWAMRHLLPDREPQFWIASGMVAALGGSLGDLTLSVIRRDLGIKDVGAFIIGRGDILTIIDRLIFVAPIYYYVMEYMLRIPA